MNRLLQHRYLVRQNMMMLIGACLCLYFSYHALHGDRGVMRLMSLDQSVETMSLENDSLHAERVALESRVRMMRPENLNRDLLEEKIRETLGYSRKDDMIVVEH